ncbi:hypothetical protein V8F33_007954 [Rhypophila sp. PSN 637]
MDAGKRAGQRVHRSLLGLHNALILSSSAILTGLLSHFIHRAHQLGYSSRGLGVHIIYQEVIAVLTLFLYLFATFLPALKSYRGYLLPLDLALSYLWLTSLIFSSRDYSGGRCSYGPPYFGHCGLKHAIQAFWILGFCMLLFNILTEAMMWAGHKASNRSALDKGNGVDGNGVHV